jgi:hypothetical protein
MRSLQERVPMTHRDVVSSLIFSWGIAMPIGIYSATHQYSSWIMWLPFWFYRGSNARLPAGVDAGLGGIFQARFFGLGFVLSGVSRRAMVVGQVCRPVKAPVMPMILVGLGNTGGYHPHRARQSAR